ncbi:recombinase family protein [Roseospira navarrensis]|uniref:Helix-turn-helix domain-containing protein n=1 Tax=Roseospira navarrensis TaxID=140058 RepID=A0A7X1ZCS7_9PROT|nr:recombinase family protein [Roseospira navarrensis]MQX35958.1 helix-turn-helix domain-containing protein [Roseospira navarrensis]
MQTFVYARVSTAGQTTENQLHEIKAAGYVPDTVYEETISGSVKADERPEFLKMLDTIQRTRTPKRLIVTKLDRLGRNAEDIMGTVKRLAEVGCGVRVLQLGDADLTNGAGKIILATLAAVAEVERDILIERTQAGLQRAKAEGKQLGRPKGGPWIQAEKIRRRLNEGASVSMVAREFSTSRATILRINEGA